MGPNWSRALCSFGHARGSGRGSGVHIAGGGVRAMTVVGNGDGVAWIGIVDACLSTHGSLG